MRAVLASLLIVCAVAAPIVLALRQQHEVRHFHVVRDGVLYRSAQLSTAGLKQVLHDHGIRTVISLRESDRADDQHEEAFCDAQGIRFVRIKPLSWLGVQGAAPIDAGLQRFLDVMADPDNHPVLVHCHKGIHRTGAYVAVYRMEMEGWRKDDALAEMRDMGYVQLGIHADVAGYFASYQPTGRYHLSRRAAAPLLDALARKD